VIIIGIDPGLDGAIAVLTGEGAVARWLNGRPMLEAMPRAAKVLDVSQLVTTLDALYAEACGTARARLNDDLVRRRVHAYLEKAQAFPKQGGSSSFKFGRVFGIVEGLIAAQRWPLTMVPPSVWTRAMHAGCEGSTPKQRSAVAASRLFPGIDLHKSERSRKPHEGIVDALLIAEYGRRKSTQNEGPPGRSAAESGEAMTPSPANRRLSCTPSLFDTEDR